MLPYGSHDWALSFLDYKVTIKVLDKTNELSIGDRNALLFFKLNSN